MDQWTDALSTGVPELDEHHKAIFQWIIELESAAAEDRRLFGAYAVARLSSYAKEHFAAEEALMAAADFPGLAKHIEQHEVFRARLKEIQQLSCGQGLESDAVEFLSNWLRDHIVRVDMAYVPYLKR